jgi:CheY-like chemotaxis protein
MTFQNTSGAAHGPPSASGPPRAWAGLVVDDDPLVRALLIECMRKEGMTTGEAQNGLECLHLVEVNHYDIIFMDIVMPEMDGIEAIIALRKRGVTAKIIAISAHEKVGDALLRDAALKLGADDAVAKPFNAATLVKNVLAGLGRPTL